MSGNSSFGYTIAAPKPKKKYTTFAYNTSTGRVIEPVVSLYGSDREKLGKYYNMPTNELTTEITKRSKRNYTYNKSGKKEYGLMRLAERLKRNKNFNRSDINNVRMNIPSYGSQYWGGKRKTRRSQMRKHTTRKNRR